MHYPVALQTGVSAPVLEQIALGQPPTGLQPDEAAVYDFCKTLLDGKGVSDAQFLRCSTDTAKLVLPI